MTSRSQRIYHLLPQPAQELALSFKSKGITRSRYGGDFPHILAEYDARSTWSAEEVERYRLERLVETVRHAVGHVPHYSTTAYRGLDKIESVDDLAAFPILSQDEVRALGDRLHATDDVGPRKMSFTSGTTVSPLAVPLTIRADWEKWAVWWRYRGWHGIDRQEWCAMFGGNPIAHRGSRTWRMDRGQYRILFSAYHTLPSHLDEMIEVMQKRQLRWIHGYPSVVTLVAERIVERGLQGQLPIRWVTFGSENVLDRYQELTTEAFGVAPLQHYGAAEMVANASECPSGALHIDEDFSVVEFIDGQMVGTSLVNPAFPLIRYQTKDFAELGDEGCTCGRPGRIVSSLDGRLNDYLVLADGSRLGLLGGGMLRAVTGVTGVQFFQARPGFAELHLVASRTLSEQELDAAAEKVKRFAPGGIELEVRQIPELVRTRAGKARIINQVDQPGSV